MTTAYDVPADELIASLSQRLHSDYGIEPPEWAAWVKTGVHRERQPDDPDWWYTRIAAILRKIYMRGPIGTERLRSFYGGKRDRKMKPYKSRKGSGSIVRTCLQQLEEAGLVTTVAGEGRVITSDGQALVDAVANDVASA